jgi:hypothetical protein
MKRVLALHVELAKLESHFPRAEALIAGYDATG